MTGTMAMAAKSGSDNFSTSGQSGRKVIAVINCPAGGNAFFFGPFLLIVEARLVRQAKTFPCWRFGSNPEGPASCDGGYCGASMRPDLIL